MNKVKFTNAFDACVGHAEKIDLAYIKKNYPHKIRLLDGKGDSVRITTPAGEYEVTRTGFSENEYRVDKV